MGSTIKIQGARENNLKNVSLEIPKDKLNVVIWNLYLPMPVSF